MLDGHPQPLPCPPCVEDPSSSSSDPVVALYAAGVSYDEIQRRCNVGRSTITSRARIAGLPPRYQPSKPPVDTTRAWELYEKGYSLREVAERLNGSYEQIRRAFHLEGRELRGPHGAHKGKRLLTRIHLERWITMLGLDEIDEVMEEMCLSLEGKLR